MDFDEPHRWSAWRMPDAPVLPVRVDPSGSAGPTRAQARGPTWRRSSYGFYVPAAVDANRPEQRAAEASVMVPRGAVTGWAALRLHGGAFFDGLASDGRTRLPVMVVSPGEARRARSGIQVFAGRLPGDELVVTHGVRCTTAARALLDQMRGAPELTEAVVAVDMALAAELVTLAEMTAYADQSPSQHGVSRVRRAVLLASDLSRSPQEVRARMIWLDSGLPKPLVNPAVYDSDGVLLGYPDLLDPETGLVCEYDGADHRDARRHSDDVRREAGFRAHGLDVTRLTGADIRDRARAAARLLDAYQRAKHNSSRPRSWTLTRLRRSAT